MKYIKSFLIINFYIIFFSGLAHAQTLKNEIHRSTIKSVQLHRKGWALSYPVMELREGQSLVLSFDDLSEQVERFHYTLIHCTADWQKSDLVPEDYLEGFTEAEIRDYKFSFNTLHDYIHYTLELPNNDMRPRYSGNYILKVYTGYNPDSVAFTWRFSIYEHQVGIGSEFRRPTLAKYMDQGQEIDFTVDYGSYPVNDPYQELKIVVRQNNRPDREIVGLMPKFVRGTKLIYDFEEETVFPGGSEFRYFGMQSLRYKSKEVKEIIFADPYYHIDLEPDHPRPNKTYSYHKDLNGNYYIDIQESERDALQADYVFVHFRLKRDFPIPGYEIYVAGKHNGWQFDKDNLMAYNPINKSYEAMLMLKQGYYNYTYIAKRKGTPELDGALVEGSHYQTENDYLIFVYHRSLSARYDRLIGFHKLNTVKRM